MNSVTVGVPVVAGPPDAAIPAPVAGGRLQSNYSRPGGVKMSPRHIDTLPPEAERALAELEDALKAHGRPCPERTAAWFDALGRGERA